MHFSRNTYVEATVHVKWQSSDYLHYDNVVLCCHFDVTETWPYFSFTSNVFDWVFQDHWDYYQNGLDYSFIHAV